MTSKELIEHLQDYDPDTIVLVYAGDEAPIDWQEVEYIVPRGLNEVQIW